MAWMLIDDWRIDVRKLEDDWLVFHGGDAQTHRLSGAAGLVFGVFWGGKMPWTIVDITNQIKKLVSDKLDENSVERAVRSLASLHLLKSI